MAIESADNMGGTGDYTIMITVNETGISDDEAEQFLSDENGMKSEFDAIGKMVSYKKLKIDNSPGVVVDFEQTVEQLDMKIKLRSRQYLILRNGMVYNVLCGIGSTDLNKNIEEMEKYSQLFQLVANSIVLNSQWLNYQE